MYSHDLFQSFEHLVECTYTYVAFHVYAYVGGGEESGVPVAAVAGGAVGGVVVLVLIVILVVLLICVSRKKGM